MKRKVIILIGLLTCLTFAACGTDEGDKNADVNGSIQDVGADDVPDREISKTAGTQSILDVQFDTEEWKEDDEEELEIDTIYNIGDSAELNDWGITVTDVQIVESIAGSFGTFSPDTEGDRFVQVFVTATNNGKEADSFLPSFSYGDDVRSKVLYGDGYEFSATNLLAYDKEMHDTTINPLSSKDGEIAFEIPESVASGEDELLIEFSAGNDSVKFKIR